MSDLGDTEISFIAQRTSFACSITLDNPSDLRGQAVTDLRSRIAAVLHESARYLSTEKISGVEKVDSVKMMMWVSFTMLFL